MGWNAGGFGSMRFPSDEAMSEWKASTLSRERWDDWFNEFEGGYLPDETVSKRLAFIAKTHDPKSYLIQEVTLDGLEVRLTWDDGEDGFRESLGDFATLVRSGADFGATGTFWFLGTAGAEGDFVYEVSLDGEDSTLEDLPRKKAWEFVQAKPYRAFMDRVMALTEAGNPAVKKLMTKLRVGEQPKARGAKWHQQVVEALQGQSGEALARAAWRYPPQYVPDGSTGQKPIRKVVTAANAVAQLLTPPNEELRGVALWACWLIAPQVALPLAKQLAADAKEAVAARVAALEVLGQTQHDDEALNTVLDVLLDWKKDGPVMVLYAAGRALSSLKNATLQSVLQTVLVELGRKKGSTGPVMVSPGVLVLNAVERHRFHSLSPQLAKLVASKADFATRQKAQALVLKFGNKDAMRTLLPYVKGPPGLSMGAASALLQLEPDDALAMIEKAAKSKKRSADVDVPAGELMAALEFDLKQRKARSLMAREPRWAEACEPFFDLKDHWLAHRAIPLVAGARKSKHVQDRLRSLLERGAQSPLPVVEALKAQGVKDVKALVKQRLAVSKDAREKDLLKVFL
ncbi:MAG: hypothetical protein U0228_31105 [Myxococcaceae bacterium]